MKPRDCATILVAAATAFVGLAQATDCTDYGDYLHWAGGMSRTGQAWRVAAADGYAYLAGGDLQVVDASDPQDLRTVATVACPDCQDVAVAGCHAYAVSANGTLLVVDVADPGQPQIVGSVALGGAPHGVAVAGPHAYVANPPVGLQVVDVADPIHPVLVGSVAVGGWPYRVAVAGVTAYVANYEPRLAVVDVAEPTWPRLIADVATMGFACDVAVTGALAFVANAGLDGTTSGVQAVDIADPHAPQITGSLVTAEWAEGVAVAGDRLLVANHRGGLLAVDFADCGDLRITGTAATRLIWAVAVDGPRAYAVGSTGYDASYWLLHVIELGNGDSAPLAGTAETPDNVYGLAVQDEYVLAADRTSGVEIIDVADPTAPQIVGNVDLFWAVGVAVAGHYAYVTADYGPRRLYVVDISDPHAPQVMGSTSLYAWAMGVAVRDDLAYVADGESGLTIVDVSAPWNPHVVGSVDTSWWSHEVAVAGDYAYVADSAGLLVIDVSVPAAPWLVGSTSDRATAVAVRDGVAFVGVEAGLQIVDVSRPASPQILRTLVTMSPVSGVAVDGDYAYAGADEMVVCDVSDLTHPRIMGSVGWGGVVAVANGCIYGGSVRDRVQISFVPCDPTGIVEWTGGDGPFGLLVAPNPAHDQVTFRLTLVRSAAVAATIYDVRGRKIRALPPRLLVSGAGDLVWDGCDDDGRDVPTGVYVARVRTAEGLRGARVVLVR